METPIGIELNVVTHSTQHLEGQPGRHEFSLPPADGGKGAWLFLAAGFVVEALVWGRVKYSSNSIR